MYRNDFETFKKAGNCCAFVLLSECCGLAVLADPADSSDKRMEGRSAAKFYSCYGEEGGECLKIQPL